MTRRWALRSAVLASGLALAATLLPGSPARAATVSADAMLLNATFANVSPPVFEAVAGPSTFNVVGACSPTVPSFFSVDDGLPASCPNLSGSGTYGNVVCGTGTLTGTFQITEPSAETASVQFTGVVIAGVAALEGSWVDDLGSGVAAGVAMVTPEPPTSCLTGVQQFQAQIVLAGVAVH